MAGPPAGAAPASARPDAESPSRTRNIDVKNKESPSRTRSTTLTRTTTYDHLTDRHNVKNDRLTNKNGDTLYLTSDHAVTPIAQTDAREPAGDA